ncbi:conserved hypothetical protein [Thermofilum pendens Hrk 5]|uniref:DUF364 domain-containing protein n=1 Tax=Thermofilum pendens (strain DSM 2475 / Hrk 5) TaxID=368408 RepID=A1S088_THEPD|nr:conserved hypothetical protein [Thermofilum pendens Hrk 5]
MYRGPALSTVGVVEEIYEYALSRAGSERVKRVVIGVHATLVELEDGRAGVAYTNREGPLSSVTPGRLRGMNVSDALGLLLSPRGLEVSVGLAAVNALLNAAGEGVVEADALEQVGVAPGDSVVLVGYFAPYVEALRGRVRRLAVLEFASVVVEGVEVYPWWAYAAVLRDADKLLITGSSIVNHTINYLLTAPTRAEKHLVGPSSPLAPEVFGRYGVKTINTAVVVDPESCATILMEGGGFSSCFREGCLRKVSARLDG